MNWTALFTACRRSLAGQLLGSDGLGRALLGSRRRVRNCEGLDVGFGEAVMSPGGRDVRGDDAGVNPPANRGDVDAESVRDLASSDMHRLFAHARSVPRAGK